MAGWSDFILPALAVGATVMSGGTAAPALAAVEGAAATGGAAAA